MQRLKEIKVNNRENMIGGKGERSYRDKRGEFSLIGGFLVRAYFSSQTEAHLN